MLFIPRILPGEFAPGYANRLMVLNDLHSLCKLKVVLIDYLRLPSDTNNPWLLLLAKASEESSANFIQQHSLLPLHRAICHDDVATHHSDFSQISVIGYSGMRLANAKIQYCWKCAQEDIESVGFTYIKRLHQLPGVDWCLNHKLPLINGNDSNPFILPNGISEFDEATLNELDPKLQSYSDILLGLLNRDRPLLVRSIKYALLVQAKQYNIRLQKKGSRKTLSDLIFETVPKDWLKRNFPEISQKKPTEYLSKIDGVVRTSKTVQKVNAFALAASVLFPTAEDALYALTTQNQDREFVPVQESHIRGKYFWMARKTLKNYVNAKGNINELTSLIGGCQSHVKVSMCKHGLPGLGKLNQETLNALMDFFETGDYEETLSRPKVQKSRFFEVLRSASPRLSEALRLLKKASVEPVSKSLSNEKVITQQSDQNIYYFDKQIAA